MGLCGQAGCCTCGGRCLRVAFLRLLALFLALPSVATEVLDGSSVLSDIASTTAIVRVERGEAEESALPAEAAHIVSPWRVDTPQALKAEVVAAEAALSLRAEVDGAPAVYESPSVSIALRRVSPETLANEWVELKSPDGADVKIPPGAKQRHGGPVTITITSYHVGGRLKLPGRVKFGQGRQLRRKLGGEESISGTTVKEDRVDFFLMKEPQKDGPARHSVQWAGTVDVKVRDPTKGRGKIKGGYEHGLGVSVPAHDREWLPGREGHEIQRFPVEKKELQLEVEGLVGRPLAEQRRGYRLLARRWHPDKNREDEDRATEVFAYLQELRETLLEQ